VGLGGGVRWLKGGRGNSAGGQLRARAGDAHEGLKKTPRAGQPEVLHEQQKRGSLVPTSIVHVSQRILVQQKAVTLLPGYCLTKSLSQ